MPMRWTVLSSVKPKRNRPVSKAPDSRQLAALILREVLAGRSLSDVAQAYLDRLPNPRDRALAQELSYGVMRWYPQLAWILRQLMNRPLKARDRDVQALLLIGLYQMRYLRVAEHAAVNETVAAAKGLGKRWAVGLINGVLREYQRRGEALLEGMAEDAEAALAMPAWLLERIRQCWPDHWRVHAAAMSERPPMSLRVNRQLIGRDDYMQNLSQQGILSSIITSTRSGLTLEQARDVSRLPGFMEGMVSVQDGGAQLAAELLDIQSGQRVLDACAAPGGKTGHILELADELRVTAVDVDQTRLDRVDDNLRRLGLSAELVLGDASRPQGEWAQRQYDRILLDVPCSACGVIRRHPDIKYLRRADDISTLVALQRRILDAIWPMLRPGGKLLYATCSWLPEENEDQLVAFLAREVCARELPLMETCGESRQVGRQIAPGMGNMDGFYYALVEKAPV